MSGLITQFNFLVHAPRQHRLVAGILDFTANTTCFGTFKAVTGSDQVVADIRAILKRYDLARDSDVVLSVGVEREACPLGLAPTPSTTVALTVGDALAMTVLGERDFGPEDFAKYHPGGALGRRLMKVEEVMTKDVVVALLDDSVDYVMEIMTKNRIRHLPSVDQGWMQGILSIGDVVNAKRQKVEAENTYMRDYIRGVFS